MVEKMLALLKKGDCTTPTVTIQMDVLYGLLCTNPRVSDVLCFALFTAATLEVDEIDERKVEINSGNNAITKRVILRNRCLKLFHALLYSESQVHTNYCEDMAQVVGFDWVLLFLQEQLHPTSVVWGLRILMTLLSVPPLMFKFRHGTCNGHWLLKSDNVLNNKMVEALGTGLSQGLSGIASKRDIRHDIFQVPGFQQLNWLMPHHIEIPQVYYLLLAILLGQSKPEMPVEAMNEKMDLDAIWQFIFDKKPREVSKNSEDCAKICLSAPTMQTVLIMVRSLLNRNQAIQCWLEDHPATLTQFLFFLYHNVPDFMQTFMTAEVLTALVGTLFPMATDAQSKISPNFSLVFTFV